MDEYHTIKTNVISHYLPANSALEFFNKNYVNAVAQK